MAHESGPHGLLAIDRFSSRPRVPSLRRALSRRSSVAWLLVPRPVSWHGLRATHVPREPARHRDLPALRPLQTLHMGFRGTVARSTLADANEVHDWRIFADFAQVLIATRDDSMPTITIGVDLSRACMPSIRQPSTCVWISFRGPVSVAERGGQAPHPARPARQHPVFIHISHGKMHDVNVLDISRRGRRVLCHGSRLRRFSTAVRADGRAFFVTRGKRNLRFTRRYSHRRVDKTTGLCADQTIVLAGFESAAVYPGPCDACAFTTRNTTAAWCSCRTTSICPL